MADLIVILIIAASVLVAVIYIVKAKKRGAKCIGCSAAGTCGSKGREGCSCADTDEILKRIKNGK